MMALLDVLAVNWAVVIRPNATQTIKNAALQAWR